ncbi:MAG: DUF6077 domain-containing protein [Lachnotalea sp.]
MDTLIKILVVILWNLIIPTLIGYLLTYFLKKEDRDNIALNFVIGLATVLGVFEPITLVAIYFKLSLTLLTHVFGVIWVLLSIASFLLNFKRFYAMIKKTPSILKSLNFFLAGAMLLIMFQAYVYVEYQHIDDDDAFFVATATTSIQSDSLYVQNPYTGYEYNSLPTRYIMSPFSIYYAVMSKITNIQATIYAHTYLPIILLLFVYLVYYIWGSVLFDNSRSIGMFLFFICILNIFGNYSEFTTQSFLLLRLWQGKAILAAGIIPLLIYLCYRIASDEKQSILWSVLFMTTSAASLVTSMGIFFAPISIGCWALVDLIRTKKVKRALMYLFCCLPCALYGIIYIMII